VITDRWKKFVTVVPLAPYLVLVAVLLVAALAVTYYRWKSEIRRALQSEFLNQQQAGEIAALRRGSAQAEDRAVEAEGRAQELLGKLEKLSVASGQLSVKLQNLERAAAAEKARIAALPTDQLGIELQQTIKTAGILRFAQDDSEGARRVLEIIGERDSCREQSGLKDQQFANCRESLEDYAAVGEQQAKQIGDLKQALDLSKRAFQKRDDLAEKQVSAAKGSWLGRAWEKIDGPVMLTLGVLIGAAATR